MCPLTLNAFKRFLMYGFVEKCEALTYESRFCSTPWPTQSRMSATST